MLYFGLILLVAVVGSVLIFKYWFARKSPEEIIAANRSESKSVYIKKYPEADVDGYNSLFIRVGLVIALLFIILAFEWNTYDQTVSDLGTLAKAEDTEVEAPQTKQEQLPPPPPPPPQLKIVEQEVKDEAPKIQESEATEQTAVAPITEAAPEEKSEEPEIFTIVEDMPAFKGCENLSNETDKKTCFDRKIMEFVTSNTHYPAIAKENGIQGKVFINFVVGPDGNVKNVKVLRGIGGGCDEEAIRVIQSLPKMQPGKQRGKPVPVQFNLPVFFKLQ